MKPPRQKSFSVVYHQLKEYSLMEKQEPLEIEFPDWNKAVNYQLTWKRFVQWTLYSAKGNSEEERQAKLCEKWYWSLRDSLGNSSHRQAKLHPEYPPKFVKGVFGYRLSNPADEKLSALLMSKGINIVGKTSSTSTEEISASLAKPTTLDALENIKPQAAWDKEAEAVAAGIIPETPEDYTGIWGPEEE